MVAAHHTLPDLDALDPHELKVLILPQHGRLLSKDEQLASRDTEIEHLKLLIAKLRRMKFGRKSRKLDRQIEQLELRLDELQATQAEHTTGSHTPAVAAPIANVAAKAARKPLPEHLPREVRKYPPKQEACPDCGGKLKPHLLRARWRSREGPIRVRATSATKGGSVSLAPGPVQPPAGRTRKGHPLVCEVAIR